MADGISQPGGAGTTIAVQDNTHIDADTDAINDIYSFNDIVLKALASGDAIDTGANTADRTFRFRASVQNGDGVGTAATTIKDTNVTVVFDNTKALITSSVGATNRVWEFGEEILGPNGKPSGRNGCKIVNGASVTIRGMIKLFGSVIRSTTSSVNLIPHVKIGSKIYNSILFSNLSFALGQDSISSSFERIYNLDLVSNSAGSPASVVNAISADQVERISVACNTPLLVFNTSSRLRVRDLVINGSPTTGDMRLTGPLESDMVEPTWSGAATQVTLSSNYLNEWWRWLPVISSRVAGAAKIPSVPCRLLDKNGAEVSGILYTDANGLLSYNLVDATLGIFDGVVKARRAIGAVAAWEDLGPFTARYNLDGVTLPQYLGEQFEFDFPRRTQTGGDQLGPMLDAVKLQPRYGGREESRASYA